MRGLNGRTNTITNITGISYDEKNKKTLFDNVCEFSKEINVHTLNVDDLNVDGVGTTRIFDYKGVVATIYYLPKTANAGDCYNVLADGNIYAFNGEEWQKIGSAMVPQLPSDAGNKTYTLRAIKGYLRWVEETVTN